MHHQQQHHYVPIPFGTGDSFAGLLTVDLPPTVVKGQEFDIVVRRITVRTECDESHRPVSIIVREPPVSIRP